MDISVLKDEINKGLRSFKAFENAAAVLTEIETLEHVQKDFQSRADKAKAFLGSLEDKVSKSSEIISETKAQAEALITEAKNTVDGLLLKANVKAGEIIAEADKKAKDIGAEIEILASRSLQLQNELSDLGAAKEKLLADIDALEAIKDKARKALGV